MAGSMDKVKGTSGVNTHHFNFLGTSGKPTLPQLQCWSGMVLEGRSQAEEEFNNSSSYSFRMIRYSWHLGQDFFPAT